MAEAATALAAAGRVKGLEVLLARHPRALLPSVLDMLGAVPETTDPKHYAPLLRQVSMGRVVGGRAGRRGCGRGVCLRPG